MKTQIRVLIADDDAGMRLILGKIIAKNPAFDVVCEASDGETAVEQAKEYCPDVVFLDIDMPKLDGISCAKEICGMNPDAVIIFATAHETYMSDAFELYAYDYLVKPFKADRVLQTLTRLEQMIYRPRQEPQRISGSKLTIRNRDGIIFIKPSDIIFIERSDRMSVITTINGEYQTAESLNELEQRLDMKLFMRSHRSYLINTSHVQKAASYGRWTYSLEFAHTERKALITHEKMDELQEIL